MSKYEVSKKNKVVRVANRGSYDKETVYEILDAGFLCQVAFNIDGDPFIIPTVYGRKGDSIYVHGSVKSRMVNAINKGIPICLSVTHVDGIVLARSVFHHSVNYRSVVVFGEAIELEDRQEKEEALFLISENILKGRWSEAREPTEKEVDITSVLEIKIETASAKIRKGGPMDDKPDYDLDIWAGVLPINYSYGEPEEDPLSTRQTKMSSVAQLAWESTK